MDYKLRQIAANKPAGTYFVVTDQSNATEIMPNENVRLAFINEKSGPINTMMYFETGATQEFQNIFGKRNRRNEKNGNFGIKSCLEMIESGPLCVINLRAFDSTLDQTSASSMGASKIDEVITNTPYSELFNKNGFWTPRSKNLLKVFGVDENLLNFANVGTGNVSIMVVASTADTVSTITSEYNKTLADVDLEIEAYPALVSDNAKKLYETFVDVYVFANTFADAETNTFYKHLFNDGELINQADIDILSNIRASGFINKFTGSLIPYLVEGTNQLSIDSVINQFYQETGLFCSINPEMLELDTYNGMPVINTTAVGYHDEEGTLIDKGNLLSYRYQDIPNVEIEFPTGVTNENFRTVETLTYSGDIFPADGQYGNTVYAILENGVRFGDTIVFRDKDTTDLVETTVTQMVKVADEQFTLPAIDVDATTFDVAIAANKPVITITTDLDTVANTTVTIWRKRTADVKFVALRTNLTIDSDEIVFTDESATSGTTYVYGITVHNPENSSSVLDSLQITNTTGETSTASVDLPTITPSIINYQKVALTCAVPVNADSYSRRLKPSEIPGLKVKLTTLEGYSPREEQFANGTSTRQDGILSVMLSPSIVGGLSKYSNVGFLVDTWKSFVEPNYKHQYGKLILAMEDCNRFYTAILNEPFIDDLEESQNPLFKDSPNGDLRLDRFLANGGNPDYSTQFLTKLVEGAESCFFYGCDNLDEPNVYPLASTISNLYINKELPWDIVANQNGILPIGGLALEPSVPERKAMEMFRWNPILKVKSDFCIYGNSTADRNNGALRHIHNSELLKYIKTELYNLSLKEGFSKGTYDELLALETEVQSFMNGLALQRAVRPNPVVKVLAVNDDETENAGIKLVEVEYYNYKTLDKVVFSLKLN